MKKLLLFGAVGFAVGAGSLALAWSNPFGWSWLPGAPAAGHDRAAMGATAASPSATAGERRIKYWRAPMDPTFIRDKPGKSPMGMDLIPVYEDEADTAPGLVRIDPGFAQNIGVQTAPVVRRDIPVTIRTVATLVHDDSQVALVTTKYAGWIERAYVNFVGQPVKAGEPLFDIYSPELVAAQEEYLNALDYAARMRDSGIPEMAQRAGSMLDAARRRLGYWDVSDAQIADLERSRQPRRTLPVVAARDGVVVWKMDQALEGMHVTSGMNLYRIADLRTIWAEAEVFESQMPWIRPGSRATIEVPYEPGRPLTATVRYLYPHLSEQTRALKVSLELPNPGGRLRAGMYVNVTFDVPAARQVLAVPEEAVIFSGTRRLVVLDLGSGTFQVREVQLGLNGDGVWEITSGVDEGNRVVVSAQFLIDSESNLREAIRKLTAEGARGTAGGGGSDMPDMPGMSKPSEAPSMPNMPNMPATSGRGGGSESPTSQQR
ncbi:MAG: efflux RND transporter periplasmic adaptor subunit [Vicinamibacterales bacterium]